ncbi:methyltransferase [Saccharospirillum impatiens]|uniref:methyltransferase n=1 Tax=Saccharospirillum impatiens TaxID=169438 RepID=UPI0003F826CE|nr:methyltransferase [Saccharospirillum impatiens]
MIGDLTQLTLRRVPSAPSLQAYNAADELVIQRLEAHVGSGEPLLLVNDAFGALATALASTRPDWWSDSAMARQAMEENIRANQAVAPRVIDSPGDLNTQYSLVILHAPKSLALFDWQLSVLSAHLIHGGECWVTGMVKHLSRGHQKIMQRHFTQIDPGLAVKKARCVRLAQPLAHATTEPLRDYVAGDSTLVSLPGCFSESRPDPGALAFLNVFDQLPLVDRFVDLGCGNGVLALNYLHRHPTSQAILVDESRQATASAAASAERNGFRVQIAHNNGLAGLALEQLPLILCNPPFHQSTTLTTDIAHRLFNEAARALADQGEFWVVGNRHLNYHNTLKRWFKQVTPVSQHPKFVIFRCTGPAP